MFAVDKIVEYPSGLAKASVTLPFRDPSPYTIEEPDKDHVEVDRVDVIVLEPQRQVEKQVTLSLEDPSPYTSEEPGVDHIPVMN